MSTLRLRFVGLQFDDTCGELRRHLRENTQCKTYFDTASKQSVLCLIDCDRLNNRRLRNNKKTKKTATFGKTPLVAVFRVRIKFFATKCTVNRCKILNWLCKLKEIFLPFYLCQKTYRQNRRQIACVAFPTGNAPWRSLKTLSVRTVNVIPGLSSWLRLFQSNFAGGCRWDKLRGLWCR